MTEVIKQALSPLNTILTTIALIVWTSLITAVITLFVIRKMKRSKRKSREKKQKQEIQPPKTNVNIEKNNYQEIIQSKDFLYNDTKEDLKKPKQNINEKDNYIIDWHTDKTKDQRSYTKKETEPMDIEQYSINWRTDRTREQRIFTEKEPEEDRPSKTNWRIEKTKDKQTHTREEKIDNRKTTKTYTQEETEKHKQRIKEIGEIGERKSNFKTLPIVVYGKQLRNLYIPTRYEETTEIDTLLISVSGIYVIETKNYSGKIYGQEEQKNWVAWYSEKKKYPFYNPIRQNEAHLMALKSKLHEVNEIFFFSIIVFSDKCNIQKIEYDRSKSLITQQGNLSEEFKEILKKNEGKLSRQEVNDIFEKLKEFANVSEEVKQRHIANVRRKKANSYYYDN